MNIISRKLLWPFFISIFLTSLGHAADKRFFNVELGCCYGSHWVSQLDTVKDNQKNIVKHVFDNIGIYSIIETSTITRYQMDEMGNLAYRYNLIIQSSGKVSNDRGSQRFSTLNMNITRYFLEKVLPEILIEFDIGVHDLKIIGTDSDNVEGFELTWKKL
jgi:hypothetical protein